MDTSVTGFPFALEGRYLLDRELGQGGMATVYLARDRKHGRVVAVKVLRAELVGGTGSERFLREIELAAGLTHPHIVPIHDSGKAGDALFYVMPYIEGESLRTRLTRERRLGAADTVRFTRDVAEALDYAHRRGVVHRDIKPENILLAEGHGVVADFGVARAVSAAGGERLTQTGSIVGTPLYMSPEQAAGEPDLDGRSDVYSLGCVVFESLTGSPPFSGSSVLAILARRLTEPAPRLTSLDQALPAALDDVLARALALNPADRFATAGGLSTALEHALTDTSMSVTDAAGAGGRRAIKPAIAVLPFLNLSSDPDNEFLSDGLAEELINALAKVPGLQVASRMSSFAFKGKESNPRAIGERLNVNAIVEGSVRKSGNRLRLAAQLVSVANGFHLWSETYDRELDDVFVLQEEIARTVVAALGPHLLPETESPLAEAGTSSVEAYTLYLRGRHFQVQLTPPTYEVALNYYEQAVAADSQYARAHAAVADCYSMLGFDEFAGLRPQEAVPPAKTAVRKALELNPDLPDAQCVHATIQFVYDWDWGGAERAFQRLVTRYPGYAQGLHWYALLLTATGRHEQGLRVMERALTLEPLTGYIHIGVARCLRYASRFEEAEHRLRSILEMEPLSIPAWLELGRTWFFMGRAGEAAQALTGLMAAVGRLPVLLAYAAAAYAAAQLPDEARRLLAELRAIGRQQYVPPLFEVLPLGWLGDLDEAFRLVDVAYEQRSGWLAFLRIREPGWEPLRTDPRYGALARRIGLDT